MSTYEWTEIIHTCPRCFASWKAPRDQPHACAVEATEARVAELEAIESTARVYFREFDHLLGSDYPERAALRNALKGGATK